MNADLFTHIAASVWWGVLGGFIPSLLTIIQWAKTPEQERSRSPLKDPGYWILLPILPVLGGLAVVVHEDNSHFTRLLSFQLGASAPLLFQQLVAAVPAIGKVG